jgi:hypothetical protein
VKYKVCSYSSLEGINFEGKNRKIKMIFKNAKTSKYTNVSMGFYKHLYRGLSTKNMDLADQYIKYGSGEPVYKIPTRV